MNRIKIIWLFSLLALSTGCATNPVTGKKDFVLMTEKEEIALGKRYHSEILKQYGVYKDPKLQNYVQKIGDRLAVKSHRHDLIFRFTVLDSPVINAFALPGGYIYITRGIMAYFNSEAELAGVLGHEIGHVTARHGVRQHSASQAANVFATIIAIHTQSRTAGNLSNILGGALLSGYGRKHELQSDRLGAEYLAHTGYNPEKMIDVIKVLKNQEEFAKARAKAEGREVQTYHGLFASHPENDKRLQEVINAAKNIKSSKKRGDRRNAYLKAIDGMVFGYSEEQGIAREGHFYHPKLGITFDLPKKWSLDNQPSQLILVAPKQKAIMQITVDDLSKRIPPEEYLREKLANAPILKSEKLSIHGLQAHSIVTKLSSNSKSKTSRVTVIYKDNQAFIFIGQSEQADDFAQYDPIFLNTAKSFHLMNEKERQLAKPYRVKLIEATEDTSYQKLAKQSVLREYAAERLRLINGQYPDGKPTKGTQLKVIQ